MTVCRDVLPVLCIAEELLDNVAYKTVSAYTLSSVLPTVMYCLKKHAGRQAI